MHCSNVWLWLAESSGGCRSLSVFVLFFLNVCCVCDATFAVNKKQIAGLYCSFCIVCVGIIITSHTSTGQFSLIKVALMWLMLLG